MNIFFLIIVGLPVLEIFTFIRVGQYIGAFNTILLIFLTATIGFYFARIQGLLTLKSAITNLYQNKSPFFEIFASASIGIAAILLIIPGFVTDAFGAFLLVPFIRNLLIKKLIKTNEKRNKNSDNNRNIIDGEIIDDNSDDKI